MFSIDGFFSEKKLALESYDLTKNKQTADKQCSKIQKSAKACTIFYTFRSL